MLEQIFIFLFFPLKIFQIIIIFSSHKITPSHSIYLELSRLFIPKCLRELSRLFLLLSSFCPTETRAVRNKKRSRVSGSCVSE